ncbi:TM0106 family RecB-like putative nuclease [Thiorhodococcus mannitoliphagus]|uniref:TM0106 family RecB-like putative nuclease n=1 Tax=Thiorhodococcus mannitoliphagus TaxID=329406 RepID=A0A6P1E0L7_9GAMM|nr:TM0106 family RecB-like putative nuclease [Thiorhodococcus mannitoliphagus]NEX23320.1 TM0106 family RecB-like putative nuclease [Thiorhodococcus mannitoliphagus]
MTFAGYILGQIQDLQPANGKIIGADLKSHVINLENEYKKLKTIIDNFDFQNLVQKKPPEPTPIILNKHCSYCQFQHFCRTEAEKEDNISLLSHATEKLIKHYEKKGIFTIKQLSYLYKPRRRKKRSKKPLIQLHKLELQALAIRTNKIYLQDLPQITRKPIELFLDIEGVPDQEYEYLIGLLVCSENNSCEHYYFWADTCEGEKKIWSQFIEKISEYNDSPIYHYGNYEVRAISKLAKRYESAIDIDDIKNRLININTFIYGQVYFPVYSNGLKDIGKFIGAVWTSPEASGLQSIVWRSYWDDTHDLKYKDFLITYNSEDCQALKLLADTLTKINNSTDSLPNVDYADQPKKLANEVATNIHNQFDAILEFAHSDYDKKKICLAKIRKKKEEPNKKHGRPKGCPGHFKRLPRARKTIFVPTRLECPEHIGEPLIESERISECIVVDLVFNKSGVKKIYLKYVGKMGFCRKCHSHYNPPAIRVNYFAYGHGLQAWAVYNRLFLRLPYRVITQTLEDQFGEKISQTSILNFMKYFSDFYTETEQALTQKILSSSFIHADETKISIQGVEQFVWVFSDGKHVVFKLTPTREARIVHEFLGEYSGTLISDFYPGYDSVKCKQQKCWVHLIRDLNDDLWVSPFDIEFEKFVLEVKNLIVPILETVDKYGAKTKRLSKFTSIIEKFYEETINKTYSSDITPKYQKRFLRYRNSLFAFIMEDDLPWNNNAGERAIRHLAVQRKISGAFFESMTPQYLLLLGLMQTCRFQNKSLLKFLLSKEKDIDEFK